MSREVRRVPLDFDWPLKQTWLGYLNPYYAHRSDCPACRGTGYAPAARLYRDQWYGNAKFQPEVYGATPLTVDHPAVQAFAARNVDHDPAFYIRPNESREDAVGREAARLFGHWKGQWSHHLIQADVDALVASNRLYDLTHRFESSKGWQPITPAPVVTADEVNAWSLSGMGHDGINQSVCVRARCVRDGEPVECSACDGHGDRWPTRAHKALCESWENIPPPTGDGWQMWETTSEGSPMSPVFATPEGLARWLADSGASAFGRETATYEQWLSTVRRSWAPSAVGGDHGLRSGVAALA